MPQTSSPATRENNITRSFDCPICYQSLAKPGPSLDKFSLGQLSKRLTQLSYLERMSIYEEFGVADQYVCNGESENDKIMATICGHIFHMGCLREWFFTRRYDRVQKCPFCKHETFYDQCRVLHPTICIPDPVMEPSEIDEEAQYSDISCTSSTYPSDNEEDYLIIQQATQEVQTENHENDMALQQINSTRDGETKSLGIMGWIKELNSTYNICHLITLKYLVARATRVYHKKKNSFMKCLENVMENTEDDELDTREKDFFVPLGFDLISLLLVFGAFIFLFESLMSGGNNKKRSGCFLLKLLLLLLSIMSIITIHPYELPC